MFSTLDHCVGHLPEDRPRYLMGVGKPDDLVGAVMRGIDMFDCVLPSRSGRTGQAFTPRGTVNIRNARHAEDPRPLDESCDCPACRNYSRAYLHHVERAQEIIGSMLMTWHNLRYYQRLMQGIRDAIADGRMSAFAAEFHAAREQGDIEPFSVSINEDSMANRAYLYALDNAPSSYRDRPDTITGLSEWSYDIPFFYRLLLSGDPRLCASLISDGLEDQDPDDRTRLYAISGIAAPALVRADQFLDLLAKAAGDTAADLLMAIRRDTRISCREW